MSLADKPVTLRQGVGRSIIKVRGRTAMPGKTVRKTEVATRTSDGSLGTCDEYAFVLVLAKETGAQHIADLYAICCVQV